MTLTDLSTETSKTSPAQIKQQLSSAAQTPARYLTQNCISADPHQAIKYKIHPQLSILESTTVAVKHHLTLETCCRRELSFQIGEKQDFPELIQPPPVYKCKHTMREVSWQPVSREYTSCTPWLSSKGEGGTGHNKQAALHQKMPRAVAESLL